MTIEEEVSKTLAELGVTEAPAVEALFAEVRAAMDSERQELVSRGAASSTEREKTAKALRDRWLGRKNGLLAHIDEKWLKPSSREMKPIVGRKFNELRQTSAQLEMEALIRDVPVRAKVNSSDPGSKDASFASTGQALSTATGTVAVTTKGSVAVEVALGAADLTLPGYRRRLGSIHPITRVQREIEDIFLGLGYSIETGPEVETAYYNFDALNIPATHPARDDMDSLYVDAETVLRTHTSPVQIRALRKHGAPLYILAPGRVYIAPPNRHLRGWPWTPILPLPISKGRSISFAENSSAKKCGQVSIPPISPSPSRAGKSPLVVLCATGQARTPSAEAVGRARRAAGSK